MYIPGLLEALDNYHLPSRPLLPKRERVCVPTLSVEPNKMDRPKFHYWRKTLDDKEWKERRMKGKNRKNNMKKKSARGLQNLPPTQSHSAPLNRRNVTWLRAIFVQLGVAVHVIDPSPSYGISEDRVLSAFSLPQWFGLTGYSCRLKCCYFPDNDCFELFDQQ